MSTPFRLQAGTPSEMNRRPASVRVAAYNIRELTREKLDAVDEDGRGTHPQLCGAAEVIQRVRPDILLVNEIDFDGDARENARLFQERYLRVGRGGQEAIDYEHIVFEPVNTGVPAKRDFNNDERVALPEDGYGYGHYPGQYGMALYSRFPVDQEALRTFRLFLWKDMPGNLMPDGRDGKPAWYDASERAIFRLSSKSHWDVPVKVGGQRLHLLASHPTPPVFDGPEDRNGRRNFDEIRLWADYIAGGVNARYIRDDQGRDGPLPDGAMFIILGDLNAEPVKDPAPYGVKAIDQLLEHPRVRDPRPCWRANAAVRGHQEASSREHRGDDTSCSGQVSGDEARDIEARPPMRAPGRATTRPVSGPAHALTCTCDFGRIDYVLPSRDLRVVDSGVYRPPDGHPVHHLIAASDHLLVWVDIAPDAGGGVD